MNKDNARDYLPLVQALADGKVIQGLYHRSNGERDWISIEGQVIFDAPASDYRIKPEPREIWIRCSDDGRYGITAYGSKESAEMVAVPGWEPVCFREVIE